MLIQYSVSLWNYNHYAHVPSLERVLGFLRDQDYGVELWPVWREEKDLFDLVGRQRLRQSLQGMRVSLHTAPGNTIDMHRKQIDAAADIGAKVIVVHARNLYSQDTSDIDMSLARSVTSYAADNGVKLALENTFEAMSVLVNAIENVEGLGICLDVGHVYFTPTSMAEYLDALGDRIIHLHLQDTLGQDESHLPSTGEDHFMPGTGSIPAKDWELLIATLKAVDFQGTGVFEVRPRNPLQIALRGQAFVRKLIGTQEDGYDS